MSLQTNSLTRMFGDRVIFENISVQTQPRARIGLVGVNGAGKSTFLQVLAGEQPPDRGHVSFAPQTKVGYLPQQVRLDATHNVEVELRTVLAPIMALEKQMRELEAQMANLNDHSENSAWKKLSDTYDRVSKQFEEQNGYAMDATVRSILTGMGFPPEQWSQAINTLSGGEKTRLGLAKLLVQKPDVLLLDEPTNHLDLPTLHWLENYMAGFAGTIIVVSHDRFFLDAVCEHIWEIENGAMRTYKGNYTRYVATKTAERELAEKAFEKQQEQIAKMEEFIQRNLARASTTKRAQSRRNALERMQRLDEPVQAIAGANLILPIESASGKDVLKIANLQLISQRIDATVQRGESITLIGPNGCGKTTFFRRLRDAFMHGEKSADTESIKWGASIRLGYYDQELGDLQPDVTILETVWQAFPHLEEKAIRSALGRMNFSGESVRRTIRGLSGGEKARVAWCKLMLLEANVLLLDEPTNHLDLWTREALEEALLDYEGTLLIISHDRYFLNKLGEKIFILDRSHFSVFSGTYDEYEQHRAKFIAQEQRNKSSLERKDEKVDMKSSNAQTNQANKDAKRELRQKQRKLEQIESEIAETEQKIAELEEKCTDEQLILDYSKWKIVDEELGIFRLRLEQLMEQWSEAAEALE